MLISKLEKKNLGSAEKDLIVKVNGENGISKVLIWRGQSDLIKQTTIFLWFQTIKSLSSNIEALKKEVELAAMAAKSKESPSQARQIVSAGFLIRASF